MINFLLINKTRVKPVSETINYSIHMLAQVCNALKCDYINYCNKVVVDLLKLRYGDI